MKLRSRTITAPGGSSMHELVCSGAEQGPCTNYCRELEEHRGRGRERERVRERERCVKRRVCVGSPASSRVVSSTESFIQPVYKPYITMCPNHRLCSSYKTVYKVSYRQVTRVEPSAPLHPQCCPGWRRLHSHNCNHAVCVQTCVNGGSCVRPNHCTCPAGWTGGHCQTDVDECQGSHGCAQRCVNSAGSYRCVCADGFRLAEDGRSCQSPPPAPTPASQPKANDRPPTSSDAVLRCQVVSQWYCTNRRTHEGHHCSLNGGCWVTHVVQPGVLITLTTAFTAGSTRLDTLALEVLGVIYAPPLSLWFRYTCGGVALAENVTEEVQILRSRVELLEQKLEMVLAPLSTLFPPEEDEKHGFFFDRNNFLSDQTNFLSHSLRQLDRIDSLSEQVGFLEERLGTYLLQSTVSTAVTKWKRLGATENRFLSGKLDDHQTAGWIPVNCSDLNHSRNLNQRKSLHPHSIHRRKSKDPSSTLENPQTQTPRDSGPFHAPNFVGQFGDGPFLFQHDRTPVHRASSIETWRSESGVEELDWPAQSPDLHPIEHLWDGLEWRLRARPSRPTSVSDLTDVLLEE
ncbi:hypothetical protein NFI96_019747, partial [Prochilodus magdalenae]